MSDESANSVQVSQIENASAPLRVVLMGASNLSLNLPTIIATARAMWRRTLEFFVASGFGRSYGQESKFFWKKFSGILQSDLWPALDRAPRLPTVAILADVGNDLAYEAPVELIHEWVTTTLDRLAAHGTHAVLSNLPIESLRTVGGLRYRALKSVLFPSCRLPRGEMLARAEVLNALLADLGKMRKIPVFSAEKAWYGLDPIHPRRRAAGEIWRTMLEALHGGGARPAWLSLDRGGARLLRRARSQSWSRSAARRGDPAPVAHLTDGTMIALF